MIVDGDETEKEFLEKCLEYWEAVGNITVHDKIKLIKIGGVFHEMKERLKNLNEE